MKSKKNISISDEAAGRAFRRARRNAQPIIEGDLGITEDNLTELIQIWVIPSLEKAFQQMQISQQKASSDNSDTELIAA